MDGTTTEMACGPKFSGIEERPPLDKGLLPGIEVAELCNTSHPVSVASSVSTDSPATLMLSEADETQCRENGRVYLPSYSSSGASNKYTEFLIYSHLPEPNRAMTSIYNDTLHGPNFVTNITTTPSPQPQFIVSTASDVISKRNDAALSPICTVSEGLSPFQKGSPFATQKTHNLDVPHEFNYPWQVIEQDQHQIRQSPLGSAGSPATPKTVSPKDTILEYSESETDGGFPLLARGFPNFEDDLFLKAIATTNPNGDNPGSIGVKIHSRNQFSCRAFHTPADVQALQHYPFIARTAVSNASPLRLNSSGTSSIESGRSTTPSCGKPASTEAESGTYTCTYRGCTLRFQTPTSLKRHKREGHRQILSRGTRRARDIGTVSTLVSTQAGPHRCDQINPGTGKPCNTIFSRPYDLTRHEDTIHNMHKHKLRCNLCMGEKTFSRGDALTRHYRVCHPRHRVTTQK